MITMAGGLGFEPRLAESESAVLPLDDPPPRRRDLLSEVIGLDLLLVKACIRICIHRVQISLG
jgi:hypothetical protein